MWEHVDLREIRVFLMLCEELHFGRTAERLRISRTRVSQTIQALEAKMGTPLFERSSRRVALTESGARLRAEIAPVHEQMSEALRRVHAAGGAIEGTLRLGQLSAPAGGHRLLQVVDAFRARHPACEVEITTTPAVDPYGQLRRGELDVMASWLPLAQPDLVVGPVLFSEPRVLLAAHDHPLAGRSEVSVEDLADYCVPRLPPIPPELHETWIPSRTPSGRPIRSVEIRVSHHDIGHLAARILRGEVVHPTIASILRYMGLDGLVCIPITDMPPMESGLVWRRSCKDARVFAFARLVEESANGNSASRHARSASVRRRTVGASG
jgi:DNA-binding transcriptional LysR family regulator